MLFQYFHIGIVLAISGSIYPFRNCRVNTHVENILVLISIYARKVFAWTWSVFAAIFGVT